MSLSQPQVKNPATRFFRWRGGAEAVKEDGKTKHEGGRLTWYSKEDEQEYDVDLPFSFIVLDELNTITGFSEKDQSGFWSNEVRNLMNDDLVVKTKSGTVARGKYGKIADQIKSKGAKYAKSVYIAFKDETGELVIGNIQIAGAALTAWIEFEKKFDVSQAAVFITDTPKLAKKGTNYYFTPEFDGQNMSDASRAAAVELDKELQKYLSTYFQRKQDDDEELEEVEDEEVVIEDVDNPIDLSEADEAEAPKKPVKKAAPAEDKDDKIPLGDIPF